MYKWMIISKLYGDELNTNDIYVGQVVKVLEESRFGIKCTAMGLSTGQTHYDDGNYDTILTRDQLECPTIMDSCDDAWSGIIFSDGSFIECGGGMHSYVVNYLRTIGYNIADRNDCVMFSATQFGRDFEYSTFGKVDDDHVCAHEMNQNIIKTYHRFVEEYASASQQLKFEKEIKQWGKQNAI